MQSEGDVKVVPTLWSDVKRGDKILGTREQGVLTVTSVEFVNHKVAIDTEEKGNVEFSLEQWANVVAE